MEHTDARGDTRLVTSGGIILYENGGELVDGRFKYVRGIWVELSCVGCEDKSEFIFKSVCFDISSQATILKESSNGFSDDVSWGLLVIAIVDLDLTGVQFPLLFLKSNVRLRRTEIYNRHVIYYQ